jgi:DNA-binding NtrC family response regulator
MSKTEILIVGRNEEILQVVIRLVNNNTEWNGIGAVTDEEAIEKFHQHHFDIVLLTNGISDEEEIKLRKIFTHQDKDIIIIQHYGGGSGLLSNEILMALDKRKKESQPSYTFREFG